MVSNGSVCVLHAFKPVQLGMKQVTEPQVVRVVRVPGRIRGLAPGQRSGGGPLHSCRGRMLACTFLDHGKIRRFSGGLVPNNSES